MNQQTDNMKEQCDQYILITTVAELLYLVYCAVNETVPSIGSVEKVDLSELYSVAEQHSLTATVAYALELAGVQDAAFLQARGKAIRRTVLMDQEMSSVLERLEETGIWYMPLKGAVLKDLYPVYGIRQMGDRDILFDADRAEDVRTIMESLGFTTEDYGKTHHDCYRKSPSINFEMHRELVAQFSVENLHPYYRDVKARLLKDEGNGYGWHFSPEDFYIYMVAHAYKHYACYGTGLRSLLDTYVYLKNVAVDLDYVTQECSKLGVADFEATYRSLALHLFGEEVLKEEEQKMLQFIVSSGTYGNERTRAKMVLDEKGRWGYFFSRITPPFWVMKELYPVLNKHPVLYPLCWAHRLVYAVLYKNKKVLYQLKAGMMWKEKK